MQRAPKLFVLELSLSRSTNLTLEHGDYNPKPIKFWERLDLDATDGAPQFSNALFGFFPVEARVCKSHLGLDTLTVIPF